MSQPRLAADQMLESLPVEPVDRVERSLSFITIALCCGVAAYKVVLAWRLNVNWDEFYFLSHVYALTRGDLTFLLQGAFTHAFTWVTRLPGQEVDQIVAGRLAMIALLAVTTWQVWRLARLWMHGLAAAVAPFVFLTAMPVLEHGGSFRADSILAPLSMAPLLLLLSPARKPSADWLAGAILGLAFAVTVKVVLFAPLFFFAILYRGLSTVESSRIEWSSVALTMARVGLAATLVAGALIGLHSLSVDAGAVGSATSVAANAAGKTLLEVPWFPRAGYLIRYFDWQPLPWILIAVGTGIALARRKFDVAAMSLSLLPLAFYRNAFPYYFVVMLAPASILAGLAISEIGAATRRHASERITAALVGALWLGTLFYGMRDLGRLALADQQLQRQVIAGVHQIFPNAVSYVDRCGMMSSFRKANFFMSTWGLESYRGRGAAIVQSTLTTQRPDFVLVNSPALDPAYDGELALLPEDRELLAKSYVQYWGPVRVAGAQVMLVGSATIRVGVPFAGLYRLNAPQPVLVNNLLRGDGDLIEVPSEGVQLGRIDGASAEEIEVRLVIATANPPPQYQLPSLPLFRNL